MTSLLLVACLVLGGQDGPRPEKKGSWGSFASDVPAGHREMLKEIVREHPRLSNRAGSVVFIDRDGEAYVNFPWLLDGIWDMKRDADQPNVYTLGSNLRIAGLPTDSEKAEKPKDPKEAAVGEDPDSEVAVPATRKEWTPPLAQGSGLYYRETIRAAKHDFTMTGTQLPTIRLAKRQGSHPTLETPYLYGSLWSPDENASMADVGFVYLADQDRWSYFARIDQRMILFRAPVPMKGGALATITMDSPLTVTLAGRERTLAVYHLNWQPTSGKMDFLCLILEPKSDGPWDKFHTAHSRTLALVQSTPSRTGSALEQGTWFDGEAVEMDPRGSLYWLSRNQTELRWDGAGAKVTNRFFSRSRPDLLSVQQWPSAEVPDKEKLGQIITKPLPNKKFRIDLIAKPPEPKTSAGGR